MVPRVDLIGVPSSAGAHGPGQEKAPAALRKAGFLQAADSAGLQIEDRGDLPLVRFAPDPVHSKQQNLGAVCEVAERVAGAVEGSVGRGNLPLVVGGDCSLTIGVIAGILRSNRRVGLLYFDGDADLSTPDTTRSGIFDSMVMSHLLGLSGAASQLSGIGPRIPLLSPDRVVLFGYMPYELEPEEVALINRLGIRSYPGSELPRPVSAPAREALAAIETNADRVVVHFDVDVLDSAEMPLGNWPHYGGLRLDEAMECLEIFLGSRKLAALVITEINPDHDPNGVLLSRFVDGLRVALRPLAAQPTAR
jgi:arginase